MLKRGTTIAGALALTLAGLLLCAGPAAAQRFYRGGGWAPAYGWNYNHASGYTPYWGGYPGGWFGYNTYSYASPQNFTYGNYYHPYSGNYWGYNYASPEYYSGYYNPGMYSTPANTGYYAPGFTGQYTTSGTNMGYGGAYESSEENMNNPNAIAVNVRVPANAKVWFDNQPTQQQGSFRQFISPPVQPGKVYTYTIKAEWMDNGQKVDKTKQVDVHAGDHFTLDMLQGKNGTVTFNNAANTNRTGATEYNNQNRTNQGTNRATVPNDNVPPSGSRTNPSDFSNAPGAGGATPNINRTNPLNNTNKNPTTGEKGTNPTGLNPTTGTPATVPTSPSSNRSTTPGTGSNNTSGTGTGTPGTTNTTGTGTGSPGKTNTSGTNNNNPGK